MPREISEASVQEINEMLQNRKLHEDFVKNCPHQNVDTQSYTWTDVCADCRTLLGRK